MVSWSIIWLIIDKNLARTVQKTNKCPSIRKTKQLVLNRETVTTDYYETHTEHVSTLSQ
jgi:hypothetical protein